MRAFAKLVAACATVLVGAGVAGAAKDNLKDPKLEDRIELCGDLAEFKVAFDYVSKLGNDAMVEDLRYGWNHLEDVASDLAESSQEFRGDAKKNMERFEKALDQGVEKVSRTEDVAEARRKIGGQIQSAHDAYGEIKQSVDCGK